MRVRSAWAMLALLSAGCDDTLFGISEGEPGAPKYEATWGGVEGFFVQRCDSCHPSLNPLDLHVDIAADIEQGTGSYVVAGDPEASYLWQLVNGDLLPDLIMPLGLSEPLPESEIGHIQEWITNGAVIE
jgi:hypothetical protein